MSFLKPLLNVGINANDAQTLEQHYAGQPEFLDGLEQVARAMIGDPLGLLVPSGEPWRTLYTNIIARPGEVQEAFKEYVATLAPALQMAISGAVTTRMGQVQNLREQFGDVEKSNGKNKKTKEYLTTLAKLGYGFKYNLCTHDVMVNGKPMTNAVFSRIYNQMADVGFPSRERLEHIILDNADLNRYHPIRDYLMSLKYQGNDEISNLASHFTDRHGVFPAWLKRWLVGSVARVFTGAQNRMLVLDGRQKLGKDFFAKWLATPMHEYFHEGAINPDDKDCRLRLLSVWIWNTSELGSTTRRQDREALKSFLTLSKVRDRKPFGKFDIQGLPMASFIGTINNEGGFLSDPTGNRRFMVANVLSIDWAYTKIDIDQVWAQAYDLYLSNEQWDLDPEEHNVADGINQEYEVEDLTRAAILKYFNIDPARPDWWMPTIDIVHELEIQGVKFGNPVAASMAVSKAIMAIGLTKKKQFNARGQLVNGYLGIRL